MAQTAMQQIIEWAISLKDKEQQCIDWICIKNKAEELLPMKKEQIQKAFSDGQETPINHPTLAHYSSEEYYNENYSR